MNLKIDLDRDRRQLVAAWPVQRRIGLLFALFLGLLALATLRATRLGTVPAGSPERRAITQQVEDLTVAARRGTVTDRRGLELAVPEDAVTVSANLFLIDRPDRVAARLAPLVGRTRDDLLRDLERPAEGLRLPSPEDGRDPRGAGQAPPHRGRRDCCGAAAKLPQAQLASQLLGTVGTDNYGALRLEHAHDEELRGDDGRRRLVKDALGEPVSMVEVDRSPGDDLRLTIDAGIQQRAEAALAEVGLAYQPRGATAVVMDPRTGAVLAMANWPWVDANDVGGAPGLCASEPGDPGELRARLHVQGVHRRRRPRGWPHHSAHPVRPSANHQGGRPGNRGGPRPRRNDASRGGHPGPVVERGLGDDRPGSSGRRASIAGSTASAGRPTGVELPGEQRASFRERRITGVVDREPADRSGARRHADPDGGGLHRDRERRRHALALRRRRRAPASRRVLSPYGRPRLEDARGRARSRRNRAGGAGHGYQLAGKTGTAEKSDRSGGYSKTRFVASFIGFAPARDPRLLVTVMVDEPKGDIYGGVVAAPAFERIVEFALRT